MHNINPNLRFQRRVTPSVETYVAAISQGNRVVLSQAITLLESTRPEHQAVAQQIIDACLPIANAQNTLRIGITGTPGVGKSTFIETFGTHFTTQGHQVAVLTIDPSSQVSHGSILGDKTRMFHLSTNPNAFIRPSPSGDSLGGVARKTRESIVLCEAAGFDTIIVETVGVGQSETAVHSMTDFFLLLLLPNAGDDLQGIKRGIVEMADMIAVNKADGDAEKAAQQAQIFYKNALHLYPPKENNWVPQVLTCSALTKAGIEDIAHLIREYQRFTQGNNFYYDNRKAQSLYWLTETIEANLKKIFYATPSVSQAFEAIQQQVLDGKMSPFAAAEKLLKTLDITNI